MFDNQEWRDLVSGIDYSTLPPHLQGGFRRYIEKGCSAGSFVNAILTNDLFLAFANADDICKKQMGDIVAFVYNNMPMTCYGTTEKVANFMRYGAEGEKQMQQFFCGECGVDRDLADAVTPITDSTGLCRFCNKQLENELGKGNPEQKVTYLNTPKMNQSIAEGIIRDMAADEGLANSIGAILEDNFKKEQNDDLL